MPLPGHDITGSQISRPAAGRSLAARLEQDRRPLFVGRQAKLCEFTGLIDQRAVPGVLTISGAGGIGQSMLLSELMAVAADRGLPTLGIDIRNLPAITPFALSAAVKDAVKKEGAPSRHPVGHGGHQLRGGALP